MPSQNYDRRSFLKALGLTGVSFFASSFIFKSGSAAALELCDKLDKKAPSMMMVNALKYVPASKTKGQNCSNCIQFKPDTANKKLGQCTILQNCSVQSAGWCASWSKKA